MNNDNNNENNNIVKPTLVDLNAVHIENTDNLLSRERDNIVSASIQANQAIDKNMATEVNNQIHINNSMTTKKKFVIIFSILILVIGAVLCFFLFKDLLKPEEKEIKTTTTVSASTEFKNKLFESTKVRRFENDSYVFFILSDQYNKYILLDKNKSLYDVGVITLSDSSISLLSNNNYVYDISFNDTSILLNNTKLSYNDSEFKYYRSDNELLLINATPDMEKAFYFTSLGECKEDTFIEMTSEIILSSGEVFAKNGDNLLHNEIELVLQ